MTTSRFESIVVPSAVFAGGAIGSMLRYAIAQAVGSASFPTATLTANLVGSFALGVVLVVGEVIGQRQGHHHRHQKRWLRLWRPFMATGVLGGFTTFSTFALELTEIAPATAIIYCLVSLGGGIAAYTAGNVMSRRVFGVFA